MLPPIPFTLYMIMTFGINYLGHGFLTLQVFFILYLSKTTENRPSLFYFSSNASLENKMQVNVQCHPDLANRSSF